MTLRFSTTLGIFDNVYDGYCKEGYREPIKFTEALAIIPKLKNINAVEIRQSDITNDLSVKTLKRMLKDYDIVCSAVSVDYSESRRFALGALGHQHAKMRSAAIDEGRKAVDIARGLGTTEVVLRLYTDGSDYPFHVDYMAQWNTIISSVKTIAKYASPDINVSILYKPHNPRKYITVSSAGRGRRRRRSQNFSKSVIPAVPKPKANKDHLSSNPPISASTTPIVITTLISGSFR